jgi:hypothetical protein
VVSRVAGPRSGVVRPRRYRNGRSRWRNLATEGDGSASEAALAHIGVVG